MERRTIKVFLDSDVILSGVISERGSPRLILDLFGLELPGLRGATGRYNLTEIERNVARKLPAARAVLNECLPRMNLEIVFLPFSDEMAPYRGAAVDEDLPVIASASMARADYFVSEDKSLLSRLGRTASFRAKPCRPDEFLDLLARALTGEVPGEKNHEWPK